MDVFYFNSLMIGISLTVVILAVIALLFGFFYFTFRVVGRVSNLERGQEAYESRIAQLMQEAFKNVPVPENPGEEIALRRDELLVRLRANQINRSEAIELNDILVKEKKAAEDRSDAVALIAIILGLALLASVQAKH